MRRRYLKGKYEDKDKYFRCPKCGATLSVERNHNFDKMSTTIVENYIVSDPYGTDMDTIVMDTLQMLGTVIGSSDIFYSSRQVSVNRGCWFCGNVNI